MKNVVYRGEDAPKNKETVWIHHSEYKNLKSPMVASIYSKGKWENLNEVANQDSNIIKVTPDISMEHDAAMFAALMKAFQQGTIFDVIIDDGYNLKRVVVANEDSVGIANTTEIEELIFEHTIRHYEGLAAIQIAAVMSGEFNVDQIPEMFYGDEDPEYELGTCVSSEGIAAPIVDEDGNVYLVIRNIGTNRIADVQKGQRAPEFSWDAGPITVPFEEVKKLIGLPIKEW